MMRAISVTRPQCPGRVPHTGGVPDVAILLALVVGAVLVTRLSGFVMRRASGMSWPKPMWEHPGLKLGNWRLPETEALCREVISLPMSAETTPEQVTIVAQTIRDFYGAAKTRGV